MLIKGEYRDILLKHNEIIKDTGWKSNTIVEDYGKYLAALMKREFTNPVGVEFLAFGSGSPNGIVDFKNKIKQNFQQINSGNTGPYINGDEWSWVKKVEDDNIEYLDSNNNESGDITSTIKVEMTIEKTEPTEDTYIFKEFGLLGIPYDQAAQQYDINKIFFINYVSHGDITKVSSMDLTRIIRLTFPITK